MISKTTGIVLRTVKHSDRASVVTVYTRDYGRMAYMVYGIYGKKSAAKAACFLPLSLIEITAAHHPGKDVQQMKEARIEENLINTHHNPIKNAIALFIAELLYKTLKHPEPESELFDFLRQSILILNDKEEGIANFHLVFAMHLCRHLGIKPNGDFANPVYFDLLNGTFVQYPPQHEHIMNPEITKLFLQLNQLSFEDMDQLKLSRESRNNLLNSIVEYYKLHMPEFYGLNCLTVLQEVFN